MGISQSFAINYKKSTNSVQNQVNVSEDSDRQQKNSQDTKPFQNLDDKHKKIINIAIASALRRLQSDEWTKEQEEEKKIISSINRYYQQNKSKSTQIDAQNMTQLDYEFILKTLRKHHLFKELFQLMNLEKDFFAMFLLTVKKKTFAFKDYIYKQYDPPSNFYIVAEGKLFVELNCMGLKPLSRGDYFGLESIIYDSDQGESVKVKSMSAILYEINREEIIKVHKKISIKNKSEIKLILQEKIIFFNFLDNKQKQNLLAQTVRSTYTKGQIIFEKDYDANAFFVIKSGFVLIKIPQKKDLILEAGSSFGESSFYQNKGQRIGKAIAFENNTVIYAIGSKAIFKSLGNKIDCAVLQNLEKWALYRDSIVNDLYFTYNYNMDKLLNKFRIKKGEKYEVLARKGDRTDKIFMNVRCQINFFKDLMVFNSRSVKALLQRYLDQTKKNQSSQNFQDTNHFTNDGSNRQTENSEEANQQFQYEVDIIVTEKGIYAQASVEQVVNLIIEAIKEPDKHKLQKFRIDLSVRSIQKYAKVSQKPLKTTILAVQKHFGIETIIKIYHKATSQSKSIFSQNTLHTLSSKYEVQSLMQNQNDIGEIYKQKSIIQGLNYPNICGFYKAQQDENNIYLILEYVKGVTLFQVQRELGIMPQVVTKFFILKLAFILDYLHQNNVIYRDLKPDNVLIDNKGFPNLFDFKTAKKLIALDKFRTSTLIGTPHYMSPQMISRKAYTFSTDYWQLGIILYQLIYEKLPFANNLNDPVEIFSQILQKQPKLKKINSQSLLKGLLQKNPEKRAQSFEEMTKHAYFENYEWELIESEKMIPPYVPKNKTKRFKNIEVFVRNQDH